MSGPFDAFLSKCLGDCVNGGSGRIYAAGIKADAEAVWLGRSKNQPPEEEARPVEAREEPSVREVYEESLCDRLPAAVKMGRRRDE